MKKQILYTFFLLLPFCLQAQIAINDDNSDPDNSAMLDIQSTDKGLLIPRMTKTQRQAISSPATSLMIFQTDEEIGFYFYNGTAWINLSSTLADADNDTKIQVEKNTDEDIIRFRIENKDYFRMKKGNLEVVNTGESVFIGKASGENDNYSFSRNIGIGDSALWRQITSYSNIAIGYRTLRYNDTGYRNVVVGQESMYFNQTGFNNVAIGYRALLDNNDGHSNSALGYMTLGNNTTGDANVGMGRYALYNNTTASDNTGIGNRALYNNNTGSNNTAIGANADVGSNNLTNATAIGANAVVNTSNSLVLGSTNVNVGIGKSNPNFALHIGRDTISINGEKIANLGGNNFGLDGDIVPYGGSSANFDLGNNNSTQHWDAVVASTFTTYSDARLKNQIADLSVGLKEVLALRPVQYKYNPEIDVDGATRFGLIAQEVEPIIPEVVINEDVDVNPETGEIERTQNEYKSMSYMDLIPVLIQAVKEQQELIEAQEKRISQLETMVNETNR